MSPLIGIPFLSAFLFVMGGVLVGHLLWYRDRHQDVKTAKDAENKYAKARASALSRKQQAQSLQGELRQLDETRASLGHENESL
ncbi:MAG: hypothetical protein AAGC97_18605, partial [Planctomycetota bacterium]